MQDAETQFHTLDFRAARFAPNGHLQTILGTFGKKYCSLLPSQQHHVILEDGDILVCEVSTPSSWTPDHPTAFLVHGLGGAHDSRYMVRMALKLKNSHFRVVRINLRGSGSGIGLARRPYHGGLSGDILQVIRHFRLQTPGLLIGYSLGGNITLKLAGEQGTDLRQHLKGIVAVCPPFDMNRTVDKIISSRFGFYEKYFLNSLRRQYNIWANSNSHIFPPSLPRKLTLIGFDDFHTAPQWRFKDARHYYTSISSANFIHGIDLPCHILCAEDDPVCDTETVHSLSLPSCVKVWKSPGGGHMGFLGSPLHIGGSRWLEDTILRMITRFH